MVQRRLPGYAARADTGTINTARMRRTLVLLTVLCAAAAPGLTGAAAATPQTSLTIAVFDHPFPAHPHHTYHLRCAPAEGDVPHPQLACRRLLAQRAPFAPLPLCRTVDVIRARVTGRFRGRPLERTYIPCPAHLAAWQRLAALLGIPAT
jgi:hypothetical protein